MKLREFMLQSLYWSSTETVQKVKKKKKKKKKNSGYAWPL